MAEPVRCLKPQGQAPQERVYNSCAYVIFCPDHETVAVCRHDQQMIWFPFAPLSSTKSWQEAAKESSLVVLADGDGDRLVALQDNPPFDDASIFEVLRVQMPQTLKFITRLVFYLRVNPRTPGFKCCQSTDRIYWEKATTVGSNLLENVWSSEMRVFCRWLKSNKTSTPHPPQKIHEHSMKHVLRYVPQVRSGDLREELLESAQITAKDVELLFRDFVDHCFPAFDMTSWSFKEYLRKYGFQPKDSKLVRLFKAFNYHRTGYLTFHELLLGLAAIDTNTQHSKPRIMFIFLYYDKSSRGYLEREDYRKMVRDMMSDEFSAEEYNKRMEHLAKTFNLALDGFGGKQIITCGEFMEAVQSHRFRGTSALCRSTKPICSLISRTVAARDMKIVQSCTQQIKVNLVVNKKSYKGKCSRCKEKKYKLQLNVTKTSKQGLTESQSLKDATTNQSQASSNTEQHYATALLNEIRIFDKGNCQNPQGVLTQAPSQLIAYLKAVGKDIVPLLSTKEGRCVEVSSPCFIIGDIHGNIADLLSLEDRLWLQLPLGANLLFLGDYVDRGKWSVECALYVLLLKILHPHKVTALRGNHEVRQIQEKYSFKSECESKYGEKHYEEIFNLFNAIFDRLPVVAIVDDSIYCAHGGIPHLKQRISDISSLPPVIEGMDSELFWEIVWSDPIPDVQYRVVCQLFGQDPEQQAGYVRNTKRGAAWYFSDAAARNFLTLNQLTHIVRAHEVPHNGFTFHFGDLCATIFSSSHYAKNNKCAVLFVDQQKIRPIIIDTVANPPPFIEGQK